MYPTRAEEQASSTYRQSSVGNEAAASVAHPPAPAASRVACRVRHIICLHSATVMPSGTVTASRRDVVSLHTPPAGTEPGPIIDATHACLSETRTLSSASAEPLAPADADAGAAAGTTPFIGPLLRAVVGVPLATICNGEALTPAWDVGVVFRSGVRDPGRLPGCPWSPGAASGPPPTLHTHVRWRPTRATTAFRRAVLATTTTAGTNAMPREERGEEMNRSVQRGVGKRALTRQGHRPRRRLGRPQSLR
eukprot:ctg_3065.g697